MSKNKFTRNSNNRRVNLICILIYGKSRQHDGLLFKHTKEEEEEKT